MTSGSARSRTTTLRRRESSRSAVLGIAMLLLVGAVISGTAFSAMLLNGVATVVEFPTRSPLPPLPAPPQSSRIVDVNGRLVAVLHGEQNRTVIPLAQMPRHLLSAVIAVEDAEFYQHRGISLSGIARSFVRNASEGELEQGGSTITQQLVRNAYPTIGKEKTFDRKVREASLAMNLESEVDKNTILERYLNTVYFGRGAYGVEAAAKTYFNKPATKLTLPQAAFLAGIIQSPERFALDIKAAKVRRDYTLDRMVATGRLDAARAESQKKVPLTFQPERRDRARAAYFVEYVRRTLTMPKNEGGFGMSDEQVLGGGLTIHTTLDLRMQDAAEKAIATVLSRKDDPEVGFVAMTTDGQIRAMVGGRNFTSLTRARGFNFAAQTARGAGRTPGSTFKTFTLAAYLDAGYSPNRVFAAPARIAVPKCGKGRGGRAWSPANYGNEGFGALSVVAATQKSTNTVYAQMAAGVGPENIVKAARAAGITSPLLPVCSLALGTLGVTPLEMARAYSTYAAGGVRPDVMAVTKIVAPGNKVVLTKKPSGKQTVRPEVALMVNKILESVVTSGTGRPAAIGRPAAGKTGTTEERRDVWYVGYTPHPGLSAAVWIGYPPDKNGRVREMRSLHGRQATGGYFGGGIWREFMRTALDGTPELSFPRASYSAFTRGMPRTGSGLRQMLPGEGFKLWHSPAPVPQQSPGQPRPKRGPARPRRGNPPPPPEETPPPDWQSG